MDCSIEIAAFLSARTGVTAKFRDVLEYGSKAEKLDMLSRTALDPDFTELIFSSFPSLALEICARWAAEPLLQIVASLARVVPSCPVIYDLAHDILFRIDVNNDIFNDLVSIGLSQPGIPKSTGADETRQQKDLLLAVFRLVLFDNTTFAKLLKPARLQLLFNHENRPIRYLAIRILCLYVHASDAVMQTMVAKYLGQDVISGEWEGKVIDYTFLTMWEERRQKRLTRKMEDTHELRQQSPNLPLPQYVFHQNELCENVVNLNGVLLYRKSGTKHVEYDKQNELVLTPTTSHSLLKIGAALTTSDPLLIIGPAGAGKTAMVRHISKRTGHAENMITLHLNEQSDAKLLIGIYSTGTQPGSFKWQPGVLTTAVVEGRWVFIEDLDRAPDDIISAILPLVERRELFIASQGEKVAAAQGFKIIATMRSHRNLRGEEIAPTAKLIGQRLWRRVNLPPLPVNELEQIALKRHPLLYNFMPRIAASYARLAEHSDMDIRAGRRSHGQPLSGREFLKWCYRIAATLHRAEYTSSADSVPEAILDSIFLDAADLISGSIEDVTARKAVNSCLAEELHINPARRDYLLENREVRNSAFSLNHVEQVELGRAVIPRNILRTSGKAGRSPAGYTPFAMTRLALRLLEQISVAVQHREPVLLVGETGIGKTTVVQQLAHMLGHKLIAINLSQQSESGDLLGGFKPVNVLSLVIPLKDEFEELFERFFPHDDNNKRFLQTITTCIAKQQWKRTVACWRSALKLARAARQYPDSTINVINGGNVTHDENPSQKRRKTNTDQFWTDFSVKVENFDKQLQLSSKAFSFVFAESGLVQAIRNGDWVLLDEINLAPSDTLESISDLIEDGSDSVPAILLTETGDAQRIEAHPNFRLFAAMNPATDVGKKDLAPSIRSRFTEIYVNSPDSDRSSLISVVTGSLSRIASWEKDRKLMPAIVDLYIDIQELLRQSRLTDGVGARPHYSLRTLTRALQYAVSTINQSSLRRALYEGFMMCFSTCLNQESAAVLDNIAKRRVFGTAKTALTELKKPLRQPDSGQFVSVSLEVTLKFNKGVVKEEHWMAQGPLPLENPAQYTVTPFVYNNLCNLIRATTTRAYPVLIQGPTSAGKTSMIEYLAKRSGNRFVRINNHEHTDLQEYLGTYISDVNGRLIFQEGVLVQALRRGDWIVLDELNLAPTDVLEALNRLLDDNRELLIPETQEVVRPSSSFMLFATQNPVGPYGGRKTLSRAFRNRFLELHFEDIPVDELNIILAKRSSIPPSWCTMIVDVYTRLSELRQENRLFEQNSFATLRDLFRWALRDADTVEDLANNGYMLLAEKVRKSEERTQVKQIIEQVMSRKGVKISISDDLLYRQECCPEMRLVEESDVVWTKAMRRLFVLVARAMRHNEPVLLVGETGCGKTTVCQLLARAMQKHLHIVNAHQNIETGDLIGAQRPIRNRAHIEQQLRSDILTIMRSGEHDKDIGSADLQTLLYQYDTTPLEFDTLPVIRSRITLNRVKRTALFEWVDGSLIQAMRHGDYYLLDEISLADDAVLERMNSVLDPQRSILLAEKGTTDALVMAEPGFQFLSTMNPGGDFGKKELSPALRNRFTEIWIPSITDSDDILLIVQSKLKPAAADLANIMVKFACWFSAEFRGSNSSAISIRDMLTWVNFVNQQSMAVMDSFIHGAAMVYIDTLGANPSALIATTGRSIEDNRSASLQKLSELLGHDIGLFYRQPLDVLADTKHFAVGSFKLSRTPGATLPDQFNFEAMTPKVNAMRVMRALQLSKPILLEGNPGVGKTAIVTALATATGSGLTRINLSEQTDLMDLFGSDAPMENAPAGQFAWRDAPFLAAMKNGTWVLLDEMNLASQAVLEGLNACLDHRGEVYISELDQTFSRHPDFRIFAAQNPHHQGGGRKGLPASFVNRFTVVYADAYSRHDLESICCRLFPLVGHELIRRLVLFVTELDVQVSRNHALGARGSPWEFNLRDSLRWLQLLSSRLGLCPAGHAQDFLESLFAQRFRTADDQDSVRKIFYDTTTTKVGLALLPRKELIQRVTSSMTTALDVHKLPLLETLMLSVQHSWPVILVGSSGSGKSLLLETLAASVGIELDVFALSADVDATDLVGGYEQVDASRSYKRVLSGVENVVRLIIAEYMVSPQAGQLTDDLSLLLDLLYQLSAHCDMVESAVILQNIFDKTRHLQNPALLKLMEEAKPLLQRTHGTDTARFEWVDGNLVTAIREGHWIVLDNANLVSASVLDRLNSLLEPNGSLIINEHPYEDGSARIITPHPNFRIFLTMDPQYGEVSSAMRNRAIEIFVPPRSSTLTTTMSITAESMTSRFRELLVLAERSKTDASLTCLLQHVVQNLSMVDMMMCERFCEQLRLGFDARDDETLLNTAINHVRSVQQMVNNTCSRAILQYYNSVRLELAVSADFGSAQSVDTLSNQPLVAYNNIHALPYDPFVLGRLYDLNLDLANMSQVLVDARSTTKPYKAMTRLERSAMAETLSKGRAESTTYAALFLHHAQQAIFTWTVESMPPKIIDIVDLRALGSIQDFWWQFWRIVNATEHSEPAFQAILIMGKTLMTDLSEASAGTSAIRASITQNLAGFKTNGQLTTGLSMDCIWQNFKPDTVSSYDRLQVLLRLTDLADHFGSIVWRLEAPIEELAFLHRSIGDAVDEATSSDALVEPLIKDLETALAQAQKTGMSETTEYCPHYKASCEALCQIADLGVIVHNEAQKTVEKNSLLALLAGRSIKSSGKLMSQNGVADSLTTLGRYLGFSGVDRTAIALGNGFVAVLAKELRSSSTVTIQQLDLLQAETFLLATSFAKEPLVHINHEYHGLRTVLNRLANGIIIAHRDVNSHATSESMLEQSTNEHLDIIRHVTQHTDPKTLGKDFLSFALACLTLYVPDRTYDPTVRPALRRQYYLEKQSQLHEKLQALVRLQQIRTGQSSNLRCELTKLDIAELGPEPQHIAVARPPVSRLNDLQAEFLSILRIVKSISPDWFDILERNVSLDPIRENVTKATLRLLSGFPEYQDITAPVIGFLHCLSLGLLLSAQANSDVSPSAQKCSLVRRAIPFVSADLSGWMTGNDIEAAFAAIAGFEDRLYLVSTLSYRAVAEAPAEWPVSLQILLSRSFHRFFVEWSDRLTADQKREAQSSSIYHYRGGQDDEDDDDEREFQDLFPICEDPVDGTATITTTSKLSPQAMARSVANLHLEIFTESDISTQYLENMVKTAFSSYQIHDDLHRGAGAIDLVPSIHLVLMDHVNKLRAGNDQQRLYNIYTDTNISEVRKVKALIDEIRNRVRPISQVWPEHATLQDILVMCGEILCLKHTEPLMRILIKLEKIHGYIAEWQTVASKEYSVVVLFNKLTDLVISWRQLELSTWARLLDLETEKCREDARSWWFIAYENVVATPTSLDLSEHDMSSHTVDLILTLQTFMVNATLGQYREKLRLLRSLLSHLQMLEPGSKSLSILRNALHHFLEHYSRFVPQVQQAIDKGRAEIEKQFKDVIQLAAWKDRNLHALRQSAKTSHRKLFRLIRKYRALLSQPAGSVLKQEVPLTSMALSSDQPIASVQSTSTSDRSAFEFCRNNHLAWSARPTRYQAVSYTVAMMKHRVPALDERFSDRVEDVMEFMETLQRTITQLQKSTPSVLSEENTAIVKHLAARKRKVLADTLKDVRKMGFRSDISPAILSAQSSFAKVVIELPVLHSSLFSQETADINGLLYQLLDTMPSVRDALVEHNEELNQPEVARSVGYLESQLSLVLKQRAQLATSITRAQALSAAVDQARSLWSSACQVTTATYVGASKARSFVVISRWLPHMIDFGMRVLTIQSKMRAVDLSHIIQGLAAFATQCREMGAEGATMIRLPIALVHKNQATLVERFARLKSGFAQQLLDWKTEDPLLTATLEQLAKWTEYEASETPDIALSSESVDVSSRLYESLDIVLGSIQDVERAQSASMPTQDDPGWLVQVDGHRQTVLSSFHVSRFVRTFSNMLDQLCCSGVAGEPNLEYASASINLAMPIIEEYHDTYQKYIGQYAKFHHATTKLTYQLARSFCAVAKQGFCKPVEKSIEKGPGNENLESGTGLGEGEGAEDISNDIGEDEDVSELAQDEGNKQDGQIENHDDAIDIEDHLEGGAGEKNDHDEEDDDNADERNEEGQEQEGEIGDGDTRGGAEEEADDEGVEDEVGDTDELDPSAVDEKLWDQAGDEAAKEKEGDKSSTKQRKDEQAAGKDKAQKDQQVDEAGENVDGQIDGQDEGDDDSNMDDVDTGLPEHDETLDPHLQETEAMELPDDLQLDGEKGQDDDPADDNQDEQMLDAENLEEDQSAVPTDAIEEPLKTFEEINGAEAERNDEQESAADQPDDKDASDEDGPNQDQGENAHDCSELDEFGEERGGGQSSGEREHDAQDSQVDVNAQAATMEQAEERDSGNASSAQRESGGETSENRQQQDEGTQGKMEDSNEPADREVVRKLGDILEKWHRQHRQVKDTASRRPDKQDEREDEDVTGTDFEHLPDDDAQADTQALGATTQDQAQALDDSMAMPSAPSEEEEARGLNEPSLPENDEEDNVDMPVESRHDGGATEEDIEAQQPQPGAAMIGGRPEPDHKDGASDVSVVGDEENVAALEDDFSTIQLRTNETSPVSEKAVSQWLVHEARTHVLSLALTEHLRLILAPTLATKLRGDFRTGKRLNIKRIIPYIASQYKRDKIWMRRSVPSKRAYQVMLAIDDSKSMGENGANELAFDTLALVARSLSMLEVGEVCVVGFGESVHVAHDFGRPLTSDAGVEVLRHFTFQQQRTNVRKLITESLELFKEARMRMSGASSAGADLWQLQLIISDGICEDHDSIRRLLLRAQEDRIMVVFVIVDAINGTQSILDLEKVEFLQASAEGGEMKLVRKKYLQTFPFGYYLLVRDVRELPSVLATALRQWFAEVAER